MRAQDERLLTPHRRLRRRGVVIPAAEVQRAVNGEEADLIRHRVLRRPIRSATPVACLFDGTIHADHDIADRQLRRHATLPRAGASCTGAHGKVARVNQREAEYIGWAALPHMRCVELCDRDVINEGEHRFAVGWCAGATQCARNECGKFC